MNPETAPETFRTTGVEPPSLLTFGKESDCSAFADPSSLWISIHESSISRCLFYGNAGALTAPSSRFCRALPPVKKRAQNLPPIQKASGERSLCVVFIHPHRSCISVYVHGAIFAMSRQLFENKPTFRAALAECAEKLKAYLDVPLFDVLFP